MKFDLKGPCRNCPFRTDRPFYLRKVFKEETREALEKHGLGFACHKTTVDDVDDDDNETLVEVPDSQMCGGAMAVLLKMGKPTQLMQVGSRLGVIDLSNVDLESPVFDTLYDWVEANNELE